MKSRIPIALLLLALVPPAHAAGRDTIQREFAKTLPLAAGKRLAVEHANGDLVVTTHASPDVKVHAVIRVSSSSDAEAKRFADEITIEAASDAGGAVVKTTYPERSFIGSMRRLSYSVDYDIEMPEASVLEARNRFGAVLATGVKGGTQVDNANGRVVLRAGAGMQRVSSSFGAVEVTGAAGDVVVTNGNGNVTVSDVKGAADLKTRFGKISATKIGKSVTIVGGNGDISIADCGPVTVNTSFGRVDARTIAGDLDVQNSNGSIEVVDVTGAADLKSSFGGIRFTNVKRASCIASNATVIGSKVKESASVRNSFGPVELSDVGGKVDVENSNGAVKVRQLRGGARLKTSFGPVEAEQVEGGLQVDNSNGSVTAHAVKGFAKVKTSFGPVSLGGIVGDLEVDNSNGSIEVEAAAHAGKECGRVTLKTSFGAVKVELPESGGYAVNARTSFGSIDSELPVTASGQMGGSVLTGKIGDGRCVLDITNSNGRISLLKAR